jgi:hypothetical protein
VADEVIVRNPCGVAGVGTISADGRPVATVAELAAVIDTTPPVTGWRSR